MDRSTILYDVLLVIRSNHGLPWIVGLILEHCPHTDILEWGSYRF